MKNLLGHTHYCMKLTDVFCTMGVAINTMFNIRTLHNVKIKGQTLWIGQCHESMELLVLKLMIDS
jgi:hypothetical protein